MAVADFFFRTELHQRDIEDRREEQRPNSVTPIMPEKTAMPGARRISAPAPCATTSGNASDERDGRHQNRAQPQTARFDGGIEG